MIKIQRHLVDELKKMMPPGEEVLVAIAHGLGLGEDSIEANVRPESHDYLVITDKRLISVRGAFFKNRSGFQAFPRKCIADVELSKQSVGTTIVVRLCDDRDPSRKMTVQFKNCNKPESELVQKELMRREDAARCPKCRAAVDPKHTYCQRCGARVKFICVKCGKQIDPATGRCSVCC